MKTPLRINAYTDVKVFRKFRKLMQNLDPRAQDVKLMFWQPHPNTVFTYKKIMRPSRNLWSVLGRDLQVVSGVYIIQFLKGRTTPEICLQRVTNLARVISNSHIQSIVQAVVLCGNRLNGSTTR